MISHHTDPSDNHEPDQLTRRPTLVTKSNQGKEGRIVVFRQARTHRRLAARERAHERFTEQVIAAQETERRHLAGDIHDGISQRLVTLSYYLDRR